MFLESVCEGRRRVPALESIGEVLEYLEKGRTVNRGALYHCSTMEPMVHIAAKTPRMPHMVSWDSACPASGDFQLPSQNPK